MSEAPKPPSLRNPREALSRAISDYLRISRGHHLYAAERAYLAAEAAAWRKVEAAFEDVGDDPDV